MLSPINHRSDHDLMALVQKGDHSAFTELYNKYWDKLLMIAWNHSNEKSIAEDIVHEVFISVWNNGQESKIDNIGGFLVTKLKFLIFENYRKQLRRTKLAENNYIFNDIARDDEQIEALFLKEYINGIVQELPNKCKLVFKYSREEGMKNAEIANAMNISEKGVEANLTRALKIIRRGIESVGIFAIPSLFMLWK